MWSRSLPMDVPYGMVHEGIKGFCEKQGVTRGGNGEGICARRSIGLLYRIHGGIFNPHDDEYGMIKRKIELQTRYQKVMGGLGGWKQIFRDGLTTML